MGIISEDVFPKKTNRWSISYEKMLNIINYQGNENQNYNINSHQLKQLLSKSQEVCIGKDVEKRKPWCTVGGNINWCSHYEKSMAAPQTTKIRTIIPYDSAIPLLGIYLRKTKTLTQKDICFPVFIVALFTIAKTWKQPKCPSMDEWIKKLWYIYRQCSIIQP